MKHTFYAPPESISGGAVLFTEEEAHHAMRVMRVKSGDDAAVVDGQGNWYAVTLDVRGRKILVGSITDHRIGVGEPPYDLTIAVGMLKNMARFETFLEKAVELGVRQIVPVVTKRSERTRLKMKRAEMILVSAMKQSGRSRLTNLAEPVKLRTWLKDVREKTSSFRAICHEGAPVDQNLSIALDAKVEEGPMEIMIGPEGGFTDEELGQAVGVGFRIVSLGPRRLRTETAAMVAAGSVMTWYLSH